MSTVAFNSRCWPRGQRVSAKLELLLLFVSHFLGLVLSSILQIPAFQIYRKTSECTYIADQLEKRVPISSFFNLFYLEGCI